MTEAAGILRKFRSAPREDLRLRLAVEGYFSDDAAPEEAEPLGAYLKRRIRPAMELLLREERYAQLERLARLGWLTPSLLDDGLQLAIQLRSTEGFVLLLQQKARQCGFSDRDFSL